MAKILSLPLVTRVEVFDTSGRPFSQRYDIAGASVHVQDDERTIKVFVDPQAEQEAKPDSGDAKPPLTALRDLLSDGLTAAHDFLGKPATPGAALDAAIGRVRDSFGGTDETSADDPTLANLQRAVAEALADAPTLLNNPEYGGTLIDVIADHLIARFTPKED